MVSYSPILIISSDSISKYSDFVSVISYPTQLIFKDSFVFFGTSHLEVK